MRNAACQQADGLKLLGLKQLAFGLFVCGDIAQHEHTTILLRMIIEHATHLCSHLKLLAISAQQRDPKLRRDFGILFRKKHQRGIQNKLAGLRMPKHQHIRQSLTDGVPACNTGETSRLVVNPLHDAI